MKNIDLSEITDKAGFLDRIASARAAIKAGRGVKIEDLESALNRPGKAKKSASSRSEISRGNKKHLD
jgi:hypothetical protein